MKIYKKYADARFHAGWHTGCFASPLPKLINGLPTEREAISAGFSKTRRKNMSQYTLVATCRSKGFKHVSDKVYYSLWGK